MWENRIISSGTMDPLDLIPNPKNWRKHPKGQAQALEGALDEIGWIQDVIVNQRTGKLLDGHLRVELAKKKGETKVPVKFVDLSEEEEAKALLTLDPISAMAEADKDILKALMDEVITDNPAIKKMIDQLAQDNKIQRKEAVEDDYEPPAEIETDIQRGDIFLLGRHRIMCGDSTCKADVDRLMDGEKADICITSPPYNVDIKYDEYEDTKGREEYKSFIIQITRLIKDILKNGRYLAWNIGVSRKTFHHDQYSWIMSNGYNYDRDIVWQKVGVPWPLFNTTRKKPVARNYHPNYTHEVVYLFTIGEPEHGSNIKINESFSNDIWQIQQSLATTDLSKKGNRAEGMREGSKYHKISSHPAAFPAAFPAALMNYLTSSGEIVYDPFLGSGTTLIACEQLDRIAYGMEISPQYVQVCIDRWEKFTGKTAVKIQEDA